MTAFWVLYAVAVVGLIVEEVALLRPAAPVVGTTPATERLALLALVVPAGGIVLTAGIGAVMGGLWGVGVVNVFGFLLCLAGIGLRYWSRRLFGRVFPIGNVGVQVARRKGLRVVHEGPYRLLRHPGYLGFLLVYAGLPLVIGTWPGFLLLTLPAVILFVRLINVEESRLLEILGPEYRHYQTRTERLVPGFW
jgi:protein-S-isoprenylcysteine O-methyltransferase Ste14